jgi:hypothetical protein
MALAKVRWLVLIGVLAVVSLLLLSKNFESKRPSSREGYGAYVVALLKRHEPKEAFAVLKKDFSSAAQEEAHTAAHEFGHALYQWAGQNSFSICDGSFGFGCFHTFIPAAIDDKGVSVVSALDQECIKAFGPLSLGCFHGIGHGLMAYHGYSKRGLNDALSLCETLSWKRPYGGCRDGVFMEYNFRTAEGSVLPTRELLESSRFEPCDAVGKSSREACFFSLPTWWEASLSKEEGRVAWMYAQCGKLVEKDSEACLRGMGYALTVSNRFDVYGAIRECKSVGSETEEELCREGAAWAFYADPNNRPDAERACSQDAPSSVGRLCLERYLFVLDTPPAI